MHFATMLTLDTGATRPEIIRMSEQIDVLGLQNRNEFHYHRRCFTLIASRNKEICASRRKHPYKDHSGAVSD